MDAMGAAIAFQVWLLFLMACVTRWHCRCEKRRRDLVDRVHALTLEVMESQGAAYLWLQTPNSAFRFKSPMRNLDSLSGAQEVLDELGRLHTETNDGFARTDFSSFK